MSIQQQQEQLTLECFICKKPITLRGYFYIVDDKIRYFHGYHDEKTIDNLALLRNCKTCGKKFKYELFNNRTRQKRLYCSRKCSNQSKAIYPKRKVDISCYSCKKEFSITLSALAKRKRHSKSGFLYCSKSCARSVQPDRYEKFYWCDLCNKWVLHDDARIKKKGEKNPSTGYRLKKDHYFCPKCNDELRTSKKHKKERKNIKKVLTP